MSKVAAARQEPFHAASPDAEQAFGNVTPTIQSETMRDFKRNATLASGMLREQIGGKWDVYFQETSNIPHDRSIKHGAKESPCLVMKKMVRTLHQMRKK